MKKKSHSVLTLCLCVISMFFILAGCKNDDSLNQYDGTKMGNGEGVIIDESNATGVALELDVYDTDELPEDSTQDTTMEYVDVESFDIPNDVEQ